ncbi:MAG: sporulation protein [Ectobacillus sp.]
MFENLMAKLGHGAAEVALYLPKDTYKAGETLRGTLIVQGGKVAQTIQSITVTLVRPATSINLGGDIEMKTFPVTAGSFQIRENETKTFPFSSSIPSDLQIDRAKEEYHLVTRLEIESAVNDHDKRRIYIISENTPTDGEYRHSEDAAPEDSHLYPPLDPYGRKFL